MLTGKFETMSELVMTYMAIAKRANRLNSQATCHIYSPEIDFLGRKIILRSYFDTLGDNAYLADVNIFKNKLSKFMTRQHYDR